MAKLKNILLGLNAVRLPVPVPRHHVWAGEPNFVPSLTMVLQSLVFVDGFPLAMYGCDRCHLTYVISCDEHFYHHCTQVQPERVDYDGTH